MEIASAREYPKEDGTGKMYHVITRAGVNHWIPDEPKNADYHELMKQEREGKIVIDDRVISD